MNSNNDITGPINLGSTNEISIRELAKKIIKLTNSNSKIIYEPLPNDDPKRRKPSVNLAINRLGWNMILI